MFKKHKKIQFLPRNAKIVFIAITVLSITVTSVQWVSAILNDSGQSASSANEYIFYALLTLVLPILAFIVSAFISRHDQGRINTLTVAAFYVQIVTTLQVPLTTAFTLVPAHTINGVNWPFIILPNCILLVLLVIALIVDRKKNIDQNQLQRSLTFKVYIAGAITVIVSYVQQLFYIFNYKWDYSFIWYDLGMLFVLVLMIFMTYKSLAYVKDKKDRIAKTLFYPSLTLLTTAVLVLTFSKLVAYVPNLTTVFAENISYVLSGSGLIVYLVILYINKKRNIL